MRRVTTRLRWYWQMEAAGALLVPAAVLLLVWQAGEAIGVALVISVLPCSFLLVLGAIYWRAVLRRLEGTSAAFNYWLPLLAAAESVALALIIASVIGISTDGLLRGGGGTAALIGSAALTLLATLEYLNYYQFQLQHFDHWADFKRLVSGKGFRRAHLARDISVWRQSLPGADHKK